MILNYITWDVNPNIFTFPEKFPLLGGRPVAWYGLLWALSFVVGYYIMKKVYKREGLNEDLLDKLLINMLFFSIIGARLGHCLFYQPEYYFSKPIEFLYIWEGGLASHGGAIGILLGLFIYSKRNKRPYIWVLDRIVIPIALAGAFIRLGNLMNSEIYGNATTLPWGFNFVRDPEWPGVPCHPTQIYEALFCIVVFVVLMYLYFKKDIIKKHPGFSFGLFCTVVFGSRILIEFIKRPQVDFESSMTLDMGQLLSIPLVIAGIYFMIKSLRNKEKRAL